jgi:hypothetical protein
MGDAGKPTLNVLADAWAPAAGLPDSSTLNARSTLRAKDLRRAGAVARLLAHD